MSAIIKHPLAKAAVVGGVFTLGAAIWMEDQIQRNFKKQDYYKASMLLLHNYEPASQSLGNPIYSGKLTLSDTEKLHVDGLKAKLEIPLKGSKDKGVLYVLASRENQGERWNIDQLHLKICSTKQKWKFYDRHISIENSQDQAT
ncbi:cytochrome c oxidase assembly factor 1 [Biomphalaria pfeifferi]|uniref:Cytochrome c oxidase assembly factor 1 n=1 Tax=Biomphalaria pfeifferi TaxID=112525 RepID=A0AAD8CCK4_BIOPF|nr:cytochrome c oxidase assembly factor 1 [Biomphalaria pfeifferi]